MNCLHHNNKRFQQSCVYPCSSSSFDVYRFKWKHATSSNFLYLFLQQRATYWNIFRNMQQQPKSSSLFLRWIRTFMFTRGRIFWICRQNKNPDFPYESRSLVGHVGYEILTAVVMKNALFWDIMSCSPLKVNRRSGWICGLHLQDWRIRQKKTAWRIKQAAWYLPHSASTSKMEATCFSETSVDFQRTTRRHIPEVWSKWIFIWDTIFSHRWL
jgi:hypothetical protein